MENDLPTKCSISEDDGPVARRGTMQWTAWEQYYRDAKLHFHLKMMKQYKWRDLDWPTPYDMPPATINRKNPMPWPRGDA